MAFVNAQEIERKLGDIWEEMAGVSEDERAVMRACVLNFLVYAGREKDAPELDECIARISQEHPSRVFLIHSGPEDSESVLSADVAARCHTLGKGRHVCCEVIKLKAQGQSADELSSLIRPLLIADIPSMLWWRPDPQFQSRLFLMLVSMCDRVILDSRHLAADQSNLGSLAELVAQRARWTVVSDLNWARLTSWRSAVAGFFDVPNWRPQLERLEDIQIEYRSWNSDSALPIQPLLAAGWIASRLKWNVAERIYRSHSGFSLIARHPGGKVNISFRPEEVSRGIVGLNSIIVSTGGEQTTRFESTLVPDGEHIECKARAGGPRAKSHVVRVPDVSEAALLCRELEILRHDRAYEQALNFVVQCV